ncbi:hypothetical protein [Rhizohabitans arisaemae]|uniref:hypothetical protein n=1 Tax=Rhizohabitans arisaemae TaxID=2720610 RepID=UPI0024B199C8|nr:hypothetical protein [Rhizohabitans arisaemae]
MTPSSVIRVVRERLSPLVHTIDWAPLAVAAITSVLVAGVTFADTGPHPQDATGLLRMSAVLLGAGAGFALVGSGPARARIRRSLRILLVAVGTVGAWTASLFIIWLRLARGTELGVVRLAVEAVAYNVAGLAFTLAELPGRFGRRAGWRISVAVLAVASATALIAGVLASGPVPGDADVGRLVHAEPDPLAESAPGVQADPGGAAQRDVTAGAGWTEMYADWLLFFPVPLFVLAFAGRNR